MSKFSEVNKKIEKAVVGGYQKVEKGVTAGYQKVEDSVTAGYQKVEDRFVDAFLRKDGETVEQAKERLKAQTQKDPSNHPHTDQR